MGGLVWTMLGWVVLGGVGVGLGNVWGLALDWVVLWGWCWVGVGLGGVGGLVLC